MRFCGFGFSFLGNHSTQIDNNSIVVPIQGNRADAVETRWIIDKVRIHKDWSIARKGCRVSINSIPNVSLRSPKSRPLTLRDDRQSFVGSDLNQLCGIMALTRTF